MDLPGRALVIGFGRTGRAVAHLLTARGVRVRVADAQDAARLSIETTGWPAVEFHLGDESLALGAAIGVVALITRQELVLLVAGGVFLVETLSVIGQVVSFRLRRKRIFRMAPIHHHFELLGWPEPQIIVRFWIVAIICALLALSTLKLR